jgi:hypothetical protein
MGRDNECKCCQRHLARRSRRPSTMAILGGVAIFLSLTSVAYAASLPRNSVGTPQIRNQAVTAAKVQNGAIGTSQLSPVVRAQLGGTGATGTIKTTVVSVVGVPGPSKTTAVARCPAGSVASGGGVVTNTGAVTNSTPGDQSSDSVAAWTGTIDNTGNPQVVGALMRVYVVCLTIS